MRSTEKIKKKKYIYSLFFVGLVPFQHTLYKYMNISSQQI